MRSNDKRIDGGRWLNAGRSRKDSGRFYVAEHAVKAHSIAG
jgi:hypothetical protein